MQAGFTFGGPIKRNKLFFFGDFVRTNDDSGRLTQGHVPEAAFRNGDFSCGADAHLRSGDRQCGRQRTHAVREQPDSGRTASARSRASLINQIPMPNIPGAAVGAINLREDLRQGAADESGRHQDHLSGRRRTTSSPCATASRTPRRWTRPSSASTAVSSRLPGRAPIRRRASAGRTTACGRRRWCRRFASAARTTTTRRLARTTG